MDNQPLTDDFQNELAEFMAAEEVAPPRPLSDQILTQVRSDLNPPVQKVFAKVGTIHLISGLLTLIICPQFGIGWTDLSFRFLQHLGGVHSTWCTFLCGAIFLGSGSLVVSFLLRPEELKVLRRWHLVHYPLFALLSLSVFLLLGQAPPSMIQSFVWLIGGIACMATIIMLALRFRTSMVPIPLFPSS